MYTKTIIILISFFLLLSKAPSYAHAEDDNKFRFAVMGCMHLGVCNFGDYELAIEKIKEFEPDFVLFLGGMIDASGGQPIETLWHKFDLMTSKLGIPVYNVPSDCRLTGLPLSKVRKSKVRKDLMQQCFINRYKNRYYSFEYKNNLFIGLDSDDLLKQKKGGLIVGNQIDFLNKTITSASKYDRIFIFLHSSPWFQDKSNDWFKFVHPLIREKVKFVFGASTHYLDANKVDDITYITSGSPPCYTPSYIRGGPKKLSFFHFLITDVNKNRVTVEIVPLKSFLIEKRVTSLEEKGLSFSPTEPTRSITKPKFLTAYEREIFLNPDRTIETLKIKPGMSILDIGAGTGFFTFRFADTLKGTGKVFATETDPKMIDYIKKKVEENKYKNISPVLVKPEGLDPFYKQYSFDLIFLCETYHYLRYPKDYFQELKPFLSKKGRLYIIHPKNVSDFSEIEFEDFKYVIKVLASEGENSPVFQKLSKEVQNFIKNWQGNEVTSEIQMKIVQDFNKMLLDRSLLYELIDFYAAKGVISGDGEWSSPLEFVTDSMDLKLAKWLIVHLDADGVFNNKKELNDIDKEQLRKLNRILLTKTFKIYKLISIHGESGPPIYVEKKSIISMMESAGYQFIREYDFLTHDYFLEFKRRF